LKSLGLKNYDELKQDVESTKRLIEKEMKLSKIWDDANQTQETKTTTESQPIDLIQEAKKYKTAEEFVKEMGNPER
jgi:hypothetical protein